MAEKNHRDIIAPSLLSCDFSRLAEEIKAVEDAGADWLHVDVMDGHFVNNLTIGPPVVASIKKASRVPLDVHLMIENPEKYIEAFVKAGADSLTIHVESTRVVGETLKKIRSLGAKPGITLRPVTPLSQITSFFDLVDLVLIMTVNPGFGGQAFMPDQVEKIREVKTWALKKNPKLHIEVDGGINHDTAASCRSAGANTFVAGSAVFRTSDYKKAITALR